MKIEPLTDAEMNMSVEEWATALMEDPSCMRTYLLAAEARGRTLAQQEARAERDAEVNALRAELDSIKEAWRQSIDNANRAWAAVEACEAKRRSDV